MLAPRQSGFVSIQGQTNAWFVAHPSLRVALAEYPKVRPPLYPILLWIGSHAGVRSATVNELLLDLTLVLIAAWTLRALPEVPALVPAALFAFLAFNYENLYQSTAEVLFVPLLLGLLLALARNRRQPGTAALWGAGALAAALGATRYFGLFLAAPVLALDGLRFSAGSGRRRLLRVAGPLVLAVGPVAAWMAVAHAETGFWTGADRTAPRHLPRQVAHWTEVQGFGPTVALVGKTLWIDFFSPDVHASLAVVTSAYVPQPVELAAAALALAAAVLASVALRRRAAAADADASGAALLAQLFCFYLILTIALWTVGNNDPPYSRFLYPCYPLLVLVACHAYGRVGRTWSSVLARLPFWTLAALLAAIHLRRAWVAAPVPFR